MGAFACKKVLLEIGMEPPPREDLLSRCNIILLNQRYCDVCSHQVEDCEHPMLWCCHTQLFWQQLSCMYRLNFYLNSLLVFIQYRSNALVVMEQEPIMAYAAWLLGWARDK